MRVHVVSKRQDACAFYRLTEPCRVLAADGFNVTVSDQDIQTLVQRRVGEAIPKMIDPGVDADVIVFPRLMDRATVEAIPDLQRCGLAVVIEVDDDFHRLPVKHPARRATGIQHNPNNNRRLLDRACQMADLVTVSTPALAQRYGSHGRVRVLRNYIPAWYLDVDVRPVRDRPWLGWTGFTEVHVGDLEVVGGAVREVVAATGVGFAHIGPVDDTARSLRLDQVTTTGKVALADYPAAFSMLDVAIAPLVLNEFNEAKSWLKMLEAAALGVPIVGSPTSEYQLAQTYGLGWLASTPGEWLRHLTHLLTSEPLRDERAGVARAEARMLTYEANAHLWAEAWEQAVTNHHERQAAA